MPRGHISGHLKTLEGETNSCWEILGKIKIFGQDFVPIKTSLKTKIFLHDHHSEGPPTFSPVTTGMLRRSRYVQTQHPPNIHYSDW